MNILIIPSFIYTEKRPTLGSFFLEQAIALKQYGHNVTILFCDTFSLKYIKDYFFYNEKRADVVEGIRIYRNKKLCPLKHSNGVKGCKETFARGIIELYQEYVKDERFDIIHAHCCIWGGYAAKRLSKKTGIPYVVTEHSSFFGLYKGYISKSMNQSIKCVYDNSKKNICVSQGLKNEIAKYCKECEIIGNVIDCDHFTLKRNKISKNFKFLSVFHMVSENMITNKGFHDLIDAFTITIKKYPDAKLYVGGTGKAFDIAKNIVREYSLESNVFFLGGLSRDEVAKQMQECDAFILPSRYETFGVVYAEAMACGKPVIATKTGGALSIVNDENGILVDVGDIEELADAMIGMIKNIEEYDANIIRDGIVTQFSAKAVAKKVSEIYYSVLKGEDDE